jgi:hypothetical protein
MSSIRFTERLSNTASAAILSLAPASCAIASRPPEVGNGIFVDAKIYNNRALQVQLQTLSNRLSQNLRYRPSLPDLPSRQVAGRTSSQSQTVGLGAGSSSQVYDVPVSE